MDDLDKVMEPVDPLLNQILSPSDQDAISTAATLAHAGRHGEAEATRYAAGYHNLSARELLR